MWERERMKRVRYILLFLFFLLVELFLILPQFGGSRRMGPSVGLHINETPNGYEIFREDQASERWDEQDPPEYYAHVLLYTWPGPVWAMFEWNERREFRFDQQTDMFSYEMGFKTDLDPEITRPIAAAILNFAKQDPQMARYRPGAGAFTVFRVDRLLATLWLWFLISLIPFTLTVSICAIENQMQDSRLSSRKAQGVCIHCEYDCSGLTSPICPECGHNHAQAQSA